MCGGRCVVEDVWWRMCGGDVRWEMCGGGCVVADVWWKYVEGTLERR